MAVHFDNSTAMPFVMMREGTSEAKIYLRGATLSSLKIHGTEWLGTRGDAQFDGSKKNISGGVPICFPQFGHGDSLGRDIPSPDNTALPVHGLARNMDWRLTCNSTWNGSVCVLELTDTAESRRIWPHEFCCKCTIKLKDNKLDWSLQVKNTSTSPWNFTCGIHSYFHTSDVSKMQIESPCFKGCTKLNRKIDPPENTEHDRDTIKIENFTDDIYKEVLPAAVTLHDYAKPSLEIVSGGGWEDIVVWNPYGNEEQAYDSFVCIESVASRAVALQPGKTWSATLTLIPGEK